MRMRKWLLGGLVVLMLLAAGGWWWTHRWPAVATVEHMGEGDDAYTLATPKGKPRNRVLIAAPADAELKDEDLLTLAQTTGAMLLQFRLPSDTDCTARLAELQLLTDRIGGPVDMVAGIKDGGALAWRWLAAQGQDGASALSVGTETGSDDADQPFVPDCSEALPTKAAHGHWHLAWNDSPSDATAIFVRNQGDRADTTIADYGTPLTTVLRDQLQRQLLGEGTGETVPTIEVPAAQPTTHGDTVTIFYSGDGGWRDLDKASADYMGRHGYPVVGVDTLRYFWEHKSPELVAADLAKLMQEYRQKWGAKRFVLAGYSFGADILPAVYNRLPKADQDAVTTMLLLAFARSGDFEIAVEGWLGKDGGEALTGPEMVKVPAGKLYCIYGAEETADSGCTQPDAIGEKLMLPGGHHYDENYDRLADFMIKAIDARMPKP